MSRRILALACAVLFASALVVAQDDKEFDAQELSTAVAEFEKGLEKVPALEGQCEQLVFKVMFSGTAWEAEVLNRLATGLREGHPPHQILGELRAIKTKEKRRLQKSASLRIDLARSTQSSGGRATVNYFLAAPGRAFAFAVDGKRVPYKWWRKSNLEEVRKLRIAQGYRRKAKGPRYPYVYDHEPKGPRLAFRSGRASLLGLFPQKWLERKKGVLSVRLSTDQFIGSGSILELDLNRGGNKWQAGLTYETAIQIPLEPVLVPTVLERFVEAASAEDGKQP